MASADFQVVIPARMASSRLPQKPLADIGGLPMVVRVARQAMASQAQRVVVAADHPDILAACQQHGVEAILTREDHPSGSDRLAEAVHILNLSDESIVVNVQGDEPLIDPDLIDACAAALDAATREGQHVSMSTCAHPIEDAKDFHNPNVVKVVCNAAGQALYFSRAPVPWWRDAPTAPDSGTLPRLNPLAPLRHIGLYAYHAGFLRKFPSLPVSPLETIESLEQLRALWHGIGIAVHVTATAPHGGVDTAADLERVRLAIRTNP